MDFAVFFFVFSWDLIGFLSGRFKPQKNKTGRGLFFPASLGSYEFFFDSKSWFQQQLRRRLWRGGAPVWGGGGGYFNFMLRFQKSERVVLFMAQSPDGCTLASAAVFVSLYLFNLEYLTLENFIIWIPEIHVLSINQGIFFFFFEEWFSKQTVILAESVCF